MTGVAALKASAKQAVHHAACWSGLSLRRALSQQRPRVLMYHAIHPTQVAAPLFEQQLVVLRRHFDVVPLATLLARRSQGTLRGNEVVLTFDDGVRNHATVVYPMLRKHALPATFFVCPGLIDSGDWIWNMELRLRLRCLDKGTRTTLAAQRGRAGGEVNDLVEWAKTLAPEPRDDFEQAVRRATPGFRPSDEQIDLCAPLSWDMARSFDPGLITLGSHTLSHPILTTVDEARLRSEIIGSRSALEQKLDRRVDYFCYPNGSNNPQAVAVVAATYTAAVTTEPGFVEAHMRPHVVARVPAGESASLFAWRLHRPTA